MTLRQQSKCVSCGEWIGELDLCVRDNKTYHYLCYLKFLQENEND